MWLARDTTDSGERQRSHWRDPQGSYVTSERESALSCFELFYDRCFRIAIQPLGVRDGKSKWALMEDTLKENIEVEGAGSEIDGGVPSGLQ